MKPSEILELSIDELNGRLADFQKTLFNLRFQHEVGQLENPKKISVVKKDIARLKTELVKR